MRQGPLEWPETERKGPAFAMKAPWPILTTQGQIGELLYWPRRWRANDGRAALFIKRLVAASHKTLVAVAPYVDVPGYDTLN